MLFVPRQGAYGAALSYLICSVFSSASLFLIYRRAARNGDLGMHPLAKD
jgi:hypothetical protein